MITRRSIFGLCLAPIVPSLPKLPEPQSRITWAGVKARLAMHEEAQNRAMQKAFMNAQVVPWGHDGSTWILTRGGGGGGTQETNPVT